MSCTTAIWGRDKAGKTHLALTWPRPVLLDNDRRYQFLRPKFPEAMFVECVVPLSLNGTVISSYEQSWEDHQKQFQAALLSPIQTIIIDTFTTLRTIVFEASPVAEKRKQVPFNRSWANQRLRELVLASRYYKKHLVLTHYAADQYTRSEHIEDRQKTGQEELRGWQDITYLADLVLHVQREGPLNFLTIESCAWTKNAHGLMLPEPSHARLMAAINEKLKEELGL